MRARPRSVPLLVSTAAVTAFSLVIGVAVARAPQLAAPESERDGMAAATGVGAQSATAAAVDGATDPSVVNGYEVQRPFRRDLSRPLRELRPAPPRRTRDEREEEEDSKPRAIPGHQDAPDAAVQSVNGPRARTAGATTIGATAASITAGTSFAGLTQGESCNCLPPDVNGDVGPNHIVESVNAAFAVYSKTGTRLYGPAGINTVFSGFAGACETRNDGDPVVLYDEGADRWLISQFTAAKPYYECIAVSQTADPTGAWYRYGYQLSSTDFPDYPKLGVWNGSYAMTVNWFKAGRTYGGPKVYLFDRTKMLAGQAAPLVANGPLGSGTAPMLPIDADGTNTNSNPALFVRAQSGLTLSTFSVNWSGSASNAYGAAYSTVGTLAVSGYTQLCGATRNCVPQQGTTQKLDGMGDRILHRAAYRNVGGADRVAVSMGVDAGSGRAGMRWYELDSPWAAGRSIRNQGTYAPADGKHRWMGSVAIDKTGGVGLAYSTSSGSTYPSIAATSRAVGDTANTMTAAETVLVAGTASQTGYNRWGDYSMLAVDPSDGCTFWYLGETSAGSFNWRTNIASFRSSSCV